MELYSAITRAARSLRRAPVFSITVILTLTLGVGAATAIFAIDDAVLIRSLPYGHPDRLVTISSDMPALGLHGAGITNGMFFTDLRLAHSFDGIAKYRQFTSTISDPNGAGQAERVPSAFVSANFTSVLEVNPILGRALTAADDKKGAPWAIDISEGLWKRRFGGDRNVLGKQLVVGSDRMEIVGVMPSSLRYPDPSDAIWVPLRLDPNDQYTGGFNGAALARLRAGVSIAAAERELAQILPRTAELFPNMAPGVTTQMVLDKAKPVERVVPLKTDLVGSASGMLWMIGAAALLVLLVTCANVANLLVVRADARQRELAVRSALGAGSSRVMGQFFSESGLLAAVALVMALVVAEVAVRLLVGGSPVHIPRLAEIRIDPRAIGFAVAVSAIAAAACSAVPALRFLRSDRLAALREGGGRAGTTSIARQRTRAMLVAAQMALALVALVASGLLVRSFQHLRAVRPGFNADRVATLSVSAPTSRYPKQADVVAFYRSISDRVAQLPGVTAVGITASVPLSDGNVDTDPLIVEGTWDPSKPIPALQRYTVVDAGFFQTMQIPLIAGQMFTAMGEQRWNEAVVSTETAREMFGDSTGQRAIGKRFQILPGSAYYTVIGVVRSVRDTSLFYPPTRAVYLPEAATQDTVSGQFGRSMAIVARTTGDVDATEQSIRAVVRSLDPVMPTFNVRSMATIVRDSTARLTFAMIVLGAAAAVTLVLGLIGLYGVIAYVVTLRGRELSLRMALGATPRSVLGLVAQQGLALSAMGVIAGLGLTFAVARFMRSFLFEVSELDPTTLVAATALLVVCAFVASLGPARRAARVDPAQALRGE